jgi:hypothetical protein
MTCLIALVAAAGCSSVLGFKDPSLEDPRPGPDAASDAAVDAPADVPGDVPGDTGPAACVPSACPFGCDTATNSCRDGVLWLFPSAGAFLGNAFGGTDMPPAPRAGADGKCVITYTGSPVFMARQCNPARIHAVLFVSNADSLGLMASKYGVPTTVPVQRADDTVLVANNWNDLLDINKPLRAAATTAASQAEGIIWTAANATNDSCANWTSGLSTSSGARGDTTSTNNTWMQLDVFRCDRPARLLCVCWSGGE